MKLMNALAACGVFALVVVGLLAVDLDIAQRRAHAISIREGVLWSAVWVAVSLVFNLGLYVWRGPEPAFQFLTGYILEVSLSMDNVFVFAVIFAAAKVPAAFQHRVLFWGILGALMTRGVFIAIGATLISHFRWVLYILGAFLIFTGLRLLRQKKQDLHPERNPVVKLSRRVFSFTEGFEGEAFFVRRGGRTWATPLFFVLVMIETVDILFAVDSIPAVFAVTDDPFIVYTSNLCAILGLRALYFVLAGAMIRFRYLRFGLSGVLLFVGGKMLLAEACKISTPLALGVISAILALAMGVSVRARGREQIEVSKGAG